MLSFGCREQSYIKSFLALLWLEDRRHLQFHGQMCLEAVLSLIDFFFLPLFFIGSCFIYQSVCQFILTCHGLSFSFGLFGMMRVYENV